MLKKANVPELTKTLQNPLIDAPIQPNAQTKQKVGRHMLEGGKEEGYTRYKSKSGEGTKKKNCCARLVAKKDMSPDEVKMTLFNLLPRDSPEVDDLAYFQKMPKDQHVDMLGQLVLALEIKEKKDQFQKWMKERHASDEDSHKAIWTRLDDAEKEGLVSAQTLADFLHFREIVFDTFHLLDQDGDNKLRLVTVDTNLDWQEGDINDDWQLFEDCLPDPQSDKSQKWFQQMDEAFKGGADYHEFQKMLWKAHVELGLDYVRIQNSLYKKENPYSIGLCKDLRAKKMREKLAMKESVSIIAPAKNLLADCLHILDIYTDLNLARTVYHLSRDDVHPSDHFSQEEIDSRGGKFTHDYNVCFVWICLTVFGPYLIQYSSYINQLYHKGVYKQSTFHNQSFCKKLFLFFQMTAAGLIFIPTIDFIFKLQNLVKVVTLPFNCRNKRGIAYNDAINQRFRIWIDKTLNMNEFEIVNFKQQSKFTQTIFEDWMMLLLDALIIGGCLSVPELTKKKGLKANTLFMQLGTTFISIYLAQSTLSYQSKMLKEDKLEYLLVCMKARQGWIPFGNILENRKLFEDIDFGNMELRKKGMLGTNALGAYEAVDFRFSDMTLKLFSKLVQNSVINYKNLQLDQETMSQVSLVRQNSRVSEYSHSHSLKSSKIEQCESEILNERSEGEVQRQQNQKIVAAVIEYQPKFDFGSSLDSVTAHQFLSFIDINQTRDAKFVDEKFIMNNVNWKRLVQNSIGMHKLNDKQGHPTTDFNKPLLQVCIDNEREDTQWALRELMIRLLREYECDPNIMDYQNEFTLFSYCLLSTKGRAAKLLITTCADRLDLRAENKNKSTNFGVLFKQKRDHYGKIDLAPRDYLSKVDIHASQIMTDGEELVTPICYFLKAVRPHDKNEMLTKGEYHWPEFFKTSNFVLESTDEMDNIMKLQEESDKWYRKMFGKSSTKDKKGDEEEEEEEDPNTRQIPGMQRPKVYKELLGDHFLKADLKAYYKELQEEKAQVLAKQNEIKSQVFKKFFAEKLTKTESSTNADEVDLSNVGASDKGNLSLLPVLLALFIEESSFFDFFSDFLIIIALANSEHTAWFSFSLFTVLAPYYTVYTSLINNQIDRYKQRDPSQRSCMGLIFSLICILPTMLVLLIIFDLLYMCMSVVVYPLLLPFAFCKLGEALLEKYEDSQNVMLNKLFGLTQMEVQGFRSQRTILQFQLESIPQIFFQMYLIKRLNDLHNEDTGAALGVSVDAVEFSVLCATVHVIFEIINLSVEAKASETPFLQYVVTCYNSREKWMPRQGKFQSHLNQAGGKGKTEAIEIDRPGFFCGGKLGYKIGFKYTDGTMETLLQLISNMSYLKVEHRKTLIIDDCFKDIELEKICQLGIVANKKLNLHCSDNYLDYLKQTIQNDAALMERITHPDDDDQESGDHLLVQVIKSNNKQILNLLFEIGADLKLKSKQEHKSLVHLAYDIQKHDMIALLYGQQKHFGLQQQFSDDFKRLNIIQAGEFTVPVESEDMKSYVRMVISTYFDPQKLIPSGEQLAHLESMIEDLGRGSSDKQAEVRHHAIWGASDIPPEYLLTVNDLIGESNGKKDKPQEFNAKWNGFISSITEWQQKYPTEVSVQQNQNQTSMKTAFLCKFVRFRQVFFKAFAETLNKDLIPKEIDMQTIADIEQVDLSDVVALEKVLDGTSKPIGLRQLQQLDLAVDLLGLDKDRALYFTKSRALLPESDQLNAFQTFNIESEGLTFTVPQNFTSLKSLTVLKTHKRQQVKSIDSGMIKFDHLDVGLGTFKDLPDTLGEKNKLVVFKITLDESIPEEYDGSGGDKYIAATAIETLRNNLTSGVDISDGFMASSRTHPSSFIKCTYVLALYKKVMDGKFVEAEETEEEV